MLNLIVFVVGILKLFKDVVFLFVFIVNFGLNGVFRCRKNKFCLIKEKVIGIFLLKLVW